MIILRNRLFTSKYEDEDYLEDLEDRKKYSKDEPITDAIVGGATGTLLGASGAAALYDKLPEKYNKATLALPLVGLGTGAYIGHRIGKKRQRKIVDKINKEIERYRNGDEEDRAYLRRKSGWDGDLDEHLIRIKKEK
jgi:hypothetical protein